MPERVPVLIWQAGEYPDKGIPSADESYIDELIANSNGRQIPIDIEHTGDDAVFDFGHIEPGSLYREGRDLRGVWFRPDGDADRWKTRSVSAYIHRPTKTLLKVSATQAPRVLAAGFNDSTDEVWVQGESIVPDKTVETTEVKGDAQVDSGAQFSDEIAALRAELADGKAAREVLARQYDDLLMQFSASKCEHLRDTYVAKGVAPEIVSLLAPFAVGQEFAAFNDERVNMKDAAKRVLDSLVGQVPTEAASIGAEPQINASFSVVDRLAKLEAEGLTPFQAADKLAAELKGRS